MEKDYNVTLSTLRNRVLELTDINSLYIPLQGKYTTNSEEEPFDLAQKINEFFVFDDSNPSDPRVMLLLGDTGSGKSVFTHQVFQQLWKVRKDNAPIPIWISLPELLNPFEGAVEEVLNKHEFSESQIAEMKASKKFIFLVDGYDELHQLQNCYVTNKWYEWQAKVLITCRSQALYYQKDPDKYFVPFQGEKRLPWLLRKLYVSPFSPDQIRVYVKRYNHLQPHELQIKMEDIDRIQGLNELITTPFLLHIAVEALPDILANVGVEEENSKMTQAKLYDVFIERWFTRQVKKLEITGQLKDSEEITKQQFWDYCKRLAQQMHVNEVTLIPYTPPKTGGRLFGKQEKKTIWEEFFSEETEILRSACPLKRMGDHHYGFIHASLVEYFATRAMYEEIQEQQDVKKEPEEQNKEKGEKEEVTENIDTNKLKGGIHYRVFAKEPNAIRNLADRIEMKDTFKQKMLGIVEKSKMSERYAIGAANAITSLVRAGVIFNYADLSGIRIAGADVSGGYFACVNFEGADLREVVLAKAYLWEANLRRCQLEGIQFQEYPWFKHDNQPYTDVGLDYRPDLKRLVIADGTDINIWDTQTMSCIKVLKGHEEQVSCVQFSGDGRQLVSGSHDCTARVWDLLSGHVKVLQHGSKVRSVKFSVDGGQVVSGSGDYVRVWNLMTWVSKWEWELCVLESRITSIDISGDGRHVVSGGCDKKVRLWKVGTTEVKELYGHTAEVKSVHFSSDGWQVVSGSEDNTVRIWDIVSGDAKVLRGHEREVYCVDFSRDGKHVVSGSNDNTVRVWDVVSGLAEVLRGHESRVRYVQFSGDGRQVVSGSEDYTIRIWDIGNDRAIRQHGHEGGVCSVELSVDGRQVVSGGHDNTVRIWDTVSGQVRIFHGHEFTVISVQFSRDGQQIVSGSGDKTVRVWDAVSGEAKVLGGHGSHIDSVQFSDDGRQVVSGSDDNTVRVWDVVSGKATVLRGHNKPVKSVQLSGDGRLVVSGSMDKTVRVMDMLSGEGKVMMGHQGAVYCVQFSTDFHQVVSGGEDNMIWVWNLMSDQATKLSGHEDWVSSVQFSRDERHVVSGSNDKTVRVWNVVSGEVKVLRGHESGVKSVQFSGDGRQVISMSHKTIRVWDIEHVQEVRCLAFHTVLRDFSLNDEKGLLCVGLGDGAVQCWQRVDTQWESVRLQWSSTYPNHTLMLIGCDARSSEGLSPINRLLVEQRGGRVDPEQLSKSSWMKAKLGAITTASREKVQQERDSQKDHALVFGGSRSPRTLRENEHGVVEKSVKKPSDPTSPRDKRTPFQFLTQKMKRKEKKEDQKNDRGNFP